MRVRTPLVVLLLGLALAGCGKNDSDNSPVGTTTPGTTVAVTSTAGKATPTSTAKEAVKLGVDADGKDVALTVGQGLVITLASNPTTGYLWQLADLDQNIVKQNGGQEYEQDPSPDGMVGVGGQATFNFVALTPGTTKLVLEYRRPWEQGSEPAQRLTLTLTVA
ncbi:protease inhibitor I42 family protein [Nocardia sp. NPDC051030]|uniref:protease inhibitor I42 family protein n=1 Tax=Nocardia sp. NPDC051030 TaxID=3155162 RepID=UPI00341BECD2